MCVVRQQYCWNDFNSSMDWMTWYLTNIDIHIFFLNFWIWIMDHRILLLHGWRCRCDGSCIGNPEQQNVKRAHFIQGTIYPQKVLRPCALNILHGVLIRHSLTKVGATHCLTWPESQLPKFNKRNKRFSENPFSQNYLHTTRASTSPHPTSQIGPRTPFLLTA